MLTNLVVVVISVVLSFANPTGYSLPGIRSALVKSVLRMMVVTPRSGCITLNFEWGAPFRVSEFDQTRLGVCFTFR